MSKEVMTPEERLLKEIFGPPSIGTLILRAGGWSIYPEPGFTVTPPIVPRFYKRKINETL